MQKYSSQSNFHFLFFNEQNKAQEFVIVSICLHTNLIPRYHLTKWKRNCEKRQKKKNCFVYLLLSFVIKHKLWRIQLNKNIEWLLLSQQNTNYSFSLLLMFLRSTLALFVTKILFFFILCVCEKLFWQRLTGNRFNERRKDVKYFQTFFLHWIIEQISWINFSLRQEKFFISDAESYFKNRVWTNEEGNNCIAHYNCSSLVAYRCIFEMFKCRFFFFLDMKIVARILHQMKMKTF